MKKISARELVLCALFAALTAVCSQLQIPLPLVPINLALLAVLLCGGLLHPSAAVLAMACYALMGLVGLPVFAGFKGGAGALLGSTGGYILGYIPTAWLTSLLRTRWKSSFGALCLGMLAGVALCYLLGTIWFMIATGNGLWVSLGYCVFPFLPGDALKILLAAFLSRRLRALSC